MYVVRQHLVNIIYCGSLTLDSWPRALNLMNILTGLEFPLLGTSQLFMLRCISGKFNSMLVFKVGKSAAHHIPELSICLLKMSIKRNTH